MLTPASAMSTPLSPAFGSEQTQLAWPRACLFPPAKSLTPAEQLCRLHGWHPGDPPQRLDGGTRGQAARVLPLLILSRPVQNRAAATKAIVVKEEIRRRPRLPLEGRTRRFRRDLSEKSFRPRLGPGPTRVTKHLDTNSPPARYPPPAARPAHITRTAMAVRSSASPTSSSWTKNRLRSLRLLPIMRLCGPSAFPLRSRLPTALAIALGSSWPCSASKASRSSGCIVQSRTGSLTPRPARSIHDRSTRWSAPSSS